MTTGGEFIGGMGMARINIEDCWWSDPRRTALLLEIGFEADSAAVNMWRSAQEFWGRGRGLVPREVFFKQKHAQSLINAGLADDRDTFVYIRGSSAWLDWHAEKREAARKGGQKSAQRPRNANGQLKKTPKQKPSKHQADSKLSQASDSGSLSGSDSGLGSGSVSTDLAISKKSPTPVGVYIDAYKERYGHNPEVGPREGKILGTFAGNHPDRWAELIRGYLAMPDSWAVARSHPVEVLVGKVNEIARFLATGKVVTRKVVQAAEEMIDKAQGTDKKPRKSLEELERERADMLADALTPLPKTIGGAQ